MVDLDPKIRATRMKWVAIKAAASAKGNPAELITAENKAHIASWEKARSVRKPHWIPILPKELVTASNAKLEVRKDGDILLAKAVDETDTYTLKIPGPFSTPKVLQLEMLTDVALPAGGPGLSEDGSFAISELEVTAHTNSSDKGRKVNFKSAQADVGVKEQTINRAYDNKEDTAYEAGSGKRLAVFELNNMPAVASDGRLEIVLKLKLAKKLLGCFRLSVSEQPLSAYTFVPTPVIQAMDVPAAKRSDEEWQILAIHALPIVADEALAQLPAQTNHHVATGALPHEARQGAPKGVNIMLRGDGGKSLGPAVPGALSAITELPGRMTVEEAKDEPSRRKYLARWLSDKNNPLTWRSIVNRVWHHHFGRGLVDSLNDFGRMGGKPSHPELLDWLAAEFRDSGMSLKRLHRLILTSATYRQAVASNPQAERLDADNRLLWRMNRNRLDAESFRDAVLAISCRLDPKMGGPSVLQFEAKPGFNTTRLANYDAIDWSATGPNRRSVYRFIFRTRPDPFMSAMDFPDASQFVPARSFSASPLQALVLFNNHFVLHHCDQLAQAIERNDSDVGIQIRQAFRLTLQREPSRQELTDFSSYANRHGLAATCRVLLNSNEFLFVE